jgi:putative two-component system response regulator
MTPPFADARILIVDDQPANVMLLERLLQLWEYQNIITTMDPSHVLPLVEAEVPDLVLLDINMPVLSGFDVMALLEPWTRGPERLPILVLTADATAETKRRALAAGARDFLTKPFDHTEVGLRVGNLLEIRRLHVELQDHNLVLEDRVRARTAELEQARYETLERLVLAGEFRDDDTNQHAQRLGRTAGVLAERLGLPTAEADLIRRSTPLHDIGKIGVPDTILLKPGKLTPDEHEVMKTHAVIGEQILSGGSSPVLQESATIALTHHECWDGGGYPSGLRGEDIPLSGRLAALADIFDALTHRRPYKAAWPVDEAVAEIRRLRGTHLDPAVVDAFDGLDHAALLEHVDEDGPVVLERMD